MDSVSYIKLEVLMGSASNTRWQAVSPALLSILLLIAFGAPAQAQVASEGGPQADPADVASVDDPEPFARGINSFQLMNDGKRWWVLTIYWTSERPDLPIPERYIR